MNISLYIMSPVVDSIIISSGDTRGNSVEPEKSVSLKMLVKSIYCRYGDQSKMTDILRIKVQ